MVFFFRAYLYHLKTTKLCLGHCHACHFKSMCEKKGKNMYIYVCFVANLILAN